MTEHAQIFEREELYEHQQIYEHDQQCKSFTICVTLIFI